MAKAKTKVTAKVVAKLAKTPAKLAKDTKKEAKKDGKEITSTNKKGSPVKPKKETVEKKAVNKGKPGFGKELEKTVETPTAAKATKPALKVVEDPKPVAPVVLTAEPSPKAKKIGKAMKADKSLQNLSEKPLGELQKKWNEYKEKYGKEKAPVYNMANTYEAAAPLQHKVLGWGFVVSVQNDRLEVLFESGSKVLISNYRPR